MKYRHNEPIARLNYVKEVTFEKKSLNAGQHIGKAIKFHWDFPQQGNLHNENNLQNVSKLEVEHFQKYNEYKETHCIDDDHKQDVVTFKSA